MTAVAEGRELDGSVSRVAELSPSQEGIWLLDQINPGDTSYHMWVSEWLNGDLDVEALQAALDAVVARHESLRTRFPSVDGRPTQEVLADFHVPWEVLDVSAAADPPAATRAVVDRKFVEPFDLTATPPIRATLVREGPQRHVLLLLMHHILVDGWSLGLLFDDLAAFYSGQAPDPLPVQYSQAVQWRREQLAGPAGDALFDYWRAELAGSPPLDLPTDRPRPPVRTTAGAVLPFRLPGELTAGLNRLARAERGTLFMVLLAGFNALLGRHAGQSDFCVGSVLAGRDREEVEPLIGLFARTLVLRADLSGEPTFRELLRRTRRTALGAYGHPDIPWERLASGPATNRDPSRSPFFDTMLLLQPPGTIPLNLPGLTREPYPLTLGTTKFDLIIELWPEGDGLSVALTYNTDLFDPSTAEVLAERYTALLTAAVADPDAALPDLLPSGPALTGPSIVDGPETVLELLAPHDGIALRGDGMLRYTELDERANRLAHELLARGVGPGTVVAVALDRSTDLIVALLGVLKAGAAYLPLDPAYPAPRLALMLADSGAALLLTEPGTLPAGSVPPGLSEVDVAASGGRPGTDPGVRPDPDDPAYVIYTSGSTGGPKGVVVPHRALAARVRWMCEHYGLGPDDRVLQFASVSFDTHAEEIYPCLAAGATLVLGPPGGGLEDFLATPDGAALTVLDLPTPYWHELVAAGDAVAWPPALRLLILGADQVREAALQQWRARFGGRVRVLNTYGPTETTIIATAADLTEPGTGRRPPIGAPIAGTVAYVLDDRWRPVPAGAAGELYLGGAGLATGYLNRPELTAQRFAEQPGRGRLYRTGDRVRVRADGQLEFLGRLDDQVKIRGYRIEPGEVEAAIAGCPGVRQAAVVVREDAGGLRRLVAYVAGDGTDVRPHLAARLPAYLLPAAYVAVDRIPLTVNGKVDVANLPAPPAGGGSADRPPVPRSASEDLVGCLWAEALGRDRIGRDEDVFELGGHSLLATRVRARLCQAAGVDVPLRLLFTHRTARELAAAVDAMLNGKAADPPIGRRPADAGPLPLGYDQERVWFVSQLDPADASYNVPVALRLRGPLDGDALAAALNLVVARHESLRTCFPATDGRPVQQIRSELHIELARFDATDAPGRAAEVLARRSNAPFDLAAGPLLRADLIRLGTDDHVLGLVLHHTVADAWSVGVLLEELGIAYSGGSLPPLPVQYADFTAWQRAQLDDRALDALTAYWVRRLSGVQQLDLPADRPRPATRSTRGAFLRRSLPAELTAAVRDLARAEHCTPFMALLAVFEVVLGKHGGRRDFAVGAPFAGRERIELEPLIGFFVSTVVLRADLNGDPTFRELLHRTRAAALDAYAHQHVPFERLLGELKIERDPGRPPLFQVAFGYHGATDDFTLPGIVAEPYETGYRQAKFDLAVDVWDGTDGLELVWSYNSDLFDEARIERLAGHLEHVVAVASAEPERRLSTVDLLTPAERELVVHGFNDTAAPYPDRSTLDGLVFEQVSRTPGATAVQFAGARQSYAELAAHAERVAAALRVSGVRPGDLVAVCVERCLDLPAALLGVLRAGAAYVPLDPEYPPARLAFMLEDSGARAVLTQAALRDRLPAGEVLLLEDLPAAGPVAGEPVAVDDPAYVIYTSGSTGRPKGAVISHRAIANRLDWMQKQYRLGADDVVLQKTPTSFDVSVWELFWPLSTGARLVLAEPGGHKDPAYLRRLIVDSAVTTVHFVPSMLAVFLADPQLAECTSLRRVFCSGEALPAALAHRCLAALPAELHNLYGPTEAAVDVTAWRCTPGDDPVPIGRPVQNTRIAILDEDRRPVPVGVPGELCIGGVQLANGYHRRPELTAERFVTHPDLGRLYRTGDLARWRPDGAIEYLGRLDRQVKLRGQRIELGEIEAALRAQPGVTDAAVVLREDRPGDQRLVGYLVGGEPDAARAALRDALPDYLVPAAVVGLDALPVTPNGKLDRAALPAPVVQGTAVAPANPMELAIAEVWAEVLEAEQIGVEDDFFDLGGHSLLATRVAALLRSRVGIEVSVLDVFRHRTVRALAALAEAPPRPRTLLNELTRPMTGTPTVSLVCVPYGGGSAVVYQPLADALPERVALWSVAIPGHDVGLDQARLPFDELAARLTDEVLAQVSGPIILYGHCGVGSALTVELARRLEAAGRDLEAVYLGAIFPFARPGSRVLAGLSRLARMEFLRSDQGYANWLTSLGVDLSELDRAQARTVIQNMRKDTDDAEQYFTGLFDSGAQALRAPVVTVVGERDPATDFYPERYREWHFIAERSTVVVLDEAGHFFLKHRADELAAIVTTAHRATGPQEHDTWRVFGVSRSAGRVVPTGPQPGMRRFLGVAAGQLVSITGSALTEFAVPIWIYLHTGSLARFALFAVVGLVPGMLIAPLAGAIVDRASRRAVMLAGDVAAGGVQLLFGCLLWTHRLQLWEIYPLLAGLSVALTFQRLAYNSAVPQLVPKRFLGHAAGVVQLAGGMAQLLVPLVAVGLLAAVGLGGILVIDVVSYAVAVTVVLAVRFPATMAARRKESLSTEIAEGFRYSWGNRSFRAMLLWFAGLNIFLSPLLLLISPLILSFGTLGQVGRVAFGSGVGVFVGGLALTIWGGPRRRRMRGALLCTLALAGCAMVTGLRPSLALVAAGACGMSLWLTLLNGIYSTIVQVKVPQRFHGRVFALNTLIAWSTLPIGFGIVAPYGTRLFTPLAPHAAWLVGTGPGRGVALMYLAFGVAMAAFAIVGLGSRTLGRFDDNVPDSVPDDLVGAEALARRSAGAARVTAPAPRRTGRGAPS